MRLVLYALAISLPCLMLFGYVLASAPDPVAHAAKTAAQMEME